jgi:hypothetical protein
MVMTIAQAMKVKAVKEMSNVYYVAIVIRRGSNVETAT